MKCAACNRLRLFHRRGCPESTGQWVQFNLGRDECYQWRVKNQFRKTDPPKDRSRAYKLGWEMQNWGGV